MSQLYTKKPTCRVEGIKVDGQFVESDLHRSTIYFPMSICFFKEILEEITVQ